MSRFKLSPEQIKDTIEENINSFLSNLEIYAVGRGVKAGADKASEHTLREVVRWCEELCEEHFNDVVGNYHKPKRKCEICWSDLKQSLASEGIGRPDNKCGTCTGPDCEGCKKFPPDHIDTNKKVQSKTTWNDVIQELGGLKTIEDGNVECYGCNDQYVCDDTCVCPHDKAFQAERVCTCDKTNKAFFGVGLAGDCPLHGKE